MAGLGVAGTCRFLPVFVRSLLVLSAWLPACYLFKYPDKYFTLACVVA